MRGKVFFLLFLLLSLSLFSFVGAVPVVEVVGDVDVIRAGETVLVTVGFVDGVNASFFEQISVGDIKFFEGRKEVFFDVDVIFFDGVHYLSLYTVRPGNFSLVVDQVLFEQDGVLKADNLEFAFVVGDALVSFGEGNVSSEVLSLRPGVWFSSQTPLLKLINKGEADVTVSVDEFLDDDISLSAAETFDLSFVPQQTFSLVRVSSYRDFVVPVVLLGEVESNASSLQKASEVKFDPSLIFANVIVGQPEELVVQLFNFDEENVSNFSLAQGNASFLSFVGVDELGVLQGRQSKNLSVRVNPEISGHLQGRVELRYVHEGKSRVAVLPYSLFVLPSESSEDDFGVEADSCEVVDGKVCPEDCSGKGVFIDDGTFCCLGSCRPYDLSGSLDSDDSDGSGGLLIGVIILLVLAGVGFYFWRRSKKVKPQKPEEQFKQKAQEYDQRMKKPSTDPKRVSGSLERT